MRRFARIASLVLCILMIPATVHAATLASAVTGPASIRAGETLKVALWMNGTNLRAAQGVVKYDASLLTYKSYGGVLAGWAMDIGAGTAGKVTFLGVDDKMAAPINSNKQLFTLTFQMKSGVPAGTSIKVTAEQMSVSDGTNDFDVANATYSVSVVPPASSNCDLASLTIDGATLSPEFASVTTEYAVSVPFAVTALTIRAVPADATAKVSIENNRLAAGATTDVDIIVSAQNGAQKTYTIKAFREQDPDYVPSGVSSLSDLRVDGFLLSPPFNATDTTYVVWLPTETDRIAVSATPTDARATVEVSGDASLAAGQDNPVKVVCIAEDGTTKTEYTIVAKRAPSHDSVKGTPIPLPSPDPTKEPTASPAPSTEPEQDDSPYILSGALLAVGLIAGGLGGFMISRKRYRSKIK